MAYPPGVGAGALWRIGSSEFVDSNEDGTVAGLAAAIAAVSAAGGGGVYMGPGLEGVPLVGFASNIVLHQITNDGRYIVSGLRIADILDPTKRLHFDHAAIPTGTDRVYNAPNWNGYLIIPASEGTAGQFLRSNGAGVQPAWATVSIVNALLDGANHTDTLAGAVVRGDLIVGNSTPKWARLPHGTTGQVLGTDGTDVFWTGSGVSAVEHNALAHLKPISVANCSWANSSTTITTTGGGFANVKEGDIVVTRTSATPGNIGRKVTVWTDANTITVDEQNTGTALSNVTLIFMPGDHWDDTIAQDSNGAGLGLLLTRGRGKYSATGPGTTFQEIRGPLRWMGDNDGSVGTDFRVAGSTSLVSPFGFRMMKTTSIMATLFVNDLTTSRSYRLPDIADATFVMDSGTQDVAGKRLTTGTRMKFDGTATYGAFWNASNVDRLTFDLSAMTALRAVSWPDYAGRVPVEGAAVTFSNGDTTPTVLGSRLFKTANTGATSISTFDDAVAGQEITIIFGDAATTLVDGATLVMAGSANKTFASTDTWTGVYDGAVWYEKCRSIN